jgi:hypothetical protein
MPWYAFSLQLVYCGRQTVEERVLPLCLVSFDVIDGMMCSFFTLYTLHTDGTKYLEVEVLVLRSTGILKS